MIYVIDEANTSKSSLHTFFLNVNLHDCFVVIIGRLLVKQFNYKVGAIFSIKSFKTPYLIEKVFSDESKNQQVDKDDIYKMEIFKDSE